MPEIITQKEHINTFAKTNFRNREVRFGIKPDDRRRHVYIIGKTGMGKTTMIENMVVQDIKAGNGVAFVDPHGEAVEKILNYIPPERINDVVYVNPADMDYPIAFNPLEAVDPKYKHLIASGLMGVFTKIWENVWSARMEYILNNTILALLDTPGNTMLGIARMHADKKFRAKIVKNIKDPMVRSFWEDEYANYNDRFRQEAIAPIQNKVGQFLSSSIIRNIVGQPKSTIDLREIMDNKKILLLNLSKGRIGEDNSALLGAMIITKLQLAAMSRVDLTEEERSDFYLYVDEFQNFATESFATILSEARKYRLNLIIAHQYIEQLDEKVRAAVFGNVGTIITFRIGAADGEFLEREFEPVFEQNDLINLSKFHIYLKLMIDGVASRPFSAVTLPPLAEITGSVDKAIKVSRERYGKPREEVEEKITRWMGQEYHREAAKQELTQEEEDNARGSVNLTPSQDKNVTESVQRTNHKPSDSKKYANKKPKGKTDQSKKTQHHTESKTQSQPTQKQSIIKKTKDKINNPAVKKAIEDTNKKSEEIAAQITKKLHFDFSTNEENITQEKQPESPQSNEDGTREKTDQSKKTLKPGEKIKF